MRYDNQPQAVPTLVQGEDYVATGGGRDRAEERCHPPYWPRHSDQSSNRLAEKGIEYQHRGATDAVTKLQHEKFGVV